MKVTAGKNIFNSFIKAVISVTALTMNYGLIADELSQTGYADPETAFGIVSKLLYSIDSPTITTFLLAGFLTLFYLHLYEMDALPRRTMAGVCTMAVFTVFFVITGRLFYIYHDIGLFTRGTVQFIKGLFVFCGLFLLFEGLIRFLVSLFIQYCGRKTENWFGIIFDKRHSGVIIAAILLIAWLPTIAAYYPAVFMGDSEDIIYMAYNYPSGIETSVLPLREGCYVTNHHPVIYTVYVSLILHTVRALGGSYNLGIFFCAAIQSILTLCVLTYSCMYCAYQLRNQKLAFAAVLFYALFPLIPKYAVMISKDTFFADLLLLWAIFIHKAVNTEKNMAALVLTSAGVVLIRKNGVYIIILTLIFTMVLYKNFWKRCLLVLAAVMAVNVLYSNVVLPVAGIPDGSIREMLSVPFQQTARYVKYHADEVTQEERLAIDGVLDYDRLAEIYGGGLSDPVKNTYKKYAGSRELKAYFAAWLQMLFKHPETYAAAFLNNYYGYFYLVVNDAMKLARTSVGSMANVNRDGYFDFSHLYDGFHEKLRDALTFYDLVWMQVPVINLFMTSAFYVWVVIATFFLNWIRRDKAAVVPAFLYLALILTVLVGPSNAINYERYVFPCILAMPFLLILTLSENERSRNHV